MIIVIKRSSAVLLCAIMVMGIIGGLMLVNGQDAQPVVAVNRQIIIIDAGHGEPDGGAVANDGTKEAGLNLVVAKKLEQILRDVGFEVIMTRSDEMGLHDPTSKAKIAQKKREDMKKRREIQANSGGDIFISIHMNKFGQSQYYGAQVVYTAGDEKAQRLAACIQNALRSGLDNNNKREPSACKSGIYLLQNAPVPSVIVECGFLSNQDELALLKTDEYQSKIAWAIYMGIAEYYK